MNFKKSFFICFFLAGLLLPGVDAKSKDLPEYKAKANFVVLISQFVDWPQSVFENSKEPFTIGIIGKDPFGSYLQTIARADKIDSRDIIIKNIAPGEECSSCHILFVTKGKYKRLAKIFSMVNGKPVLIIGDGEKFAWKGAHIGLYRYGRKIRFSVNLSSSKKSKLKISSQLLRLASEVYGEEK